MPARAPSAGTSHQSRGGCKAGVEHSGGRGLACSLDESWHTCMHGAERAWGLECRVQAVRDEADMPSSCLRALTLGEFYYIGEAGEG